ncbi:MAG: DUF3105 domain-containing protein [Solirubrobacterales bacterium]|nr:DUF3105 domain-containing protein [Solirubrobacterales bacterium]
MSRIVAVALGAVVLLAGLYGLSTLVSSRDDAGVNRAAGPGASEPDRGAAHRPSGDRRDPDPPTSGPHSAHLVSRDARRLSDDRILHALELGDVVLVYPGLRPPAELRAVQQEVAGPFDAELAAAGQAVVLARVPGASGIQALAWRRRLRASGPADPGVRAFAEYWLGRGLDGSR